MHCARPGAGSTGPILERALVHGSLRMMDTPGPIGSAPAGQTGNARVRLRSAGFPVRKTLDEFAVADSSIPRPTFDYLATLEWIRAKENLVLVGPAGTGKSHTLIALGHAAVTQGFRVR